MDNLNIELPPLDQPLSLIHPPSLQRMIMDYARSAVMVDRARMATVAAYALCNRAEELHIKARMPWSQAEELALEEIGFTDVELEELIGEAGNGDDWLSGKEAIERYTRAVLVHGSPYIISDQPGSIPGGFWLAPMLADTEMIRAACYFETDERVREFWLALRDSWLSRHPRGGLTEPKKPVSRQQAEARMAELQAEMRLIAPLLGLEEVIGTEDEGKAQ